MPVLMPTPAELRELTPAQREKARRAIWRILRDTDDNIRREVRNVESAAAFGEAVRERARQLEHYAPKDPPWVTAERRRLLLEAVL
jgi:hypothetical protein